MAYMRVEIDLMSCIHNENKQTIPNKVDDWTANGGLADQLIAGEGLLHKLL